MGIVQTVDTDLVWRTKNLPAFNDVLEQFDVVELTTKRSFGAGGSTATLKGIVPSNTDLSPLEETTDPNKGVMLGVNIDTTIDSTQIEDRIFTGAVVKAYQDDKRVVTLELMDRRELLNRKRVALDTRREGEYTTTIVREILGNEIGLEEGEDFIIDFVDEIPDGFAFGGPRPQPSIVYKVYGANKTTTAFDVLMDLARIEDAALWIDKYNRIRFEYAPEFNYIRELDYIISYTEETEQSNARRVIVDSTFDETGVGAFRTTSGENREAEVNHKQADKDKKSPIRIEADNVDDIDAQEKRAQSEIADSLFTQSSGTVTVLGNPRFGVNDQLVISDVPEWAPMNGGTYTIKTITHELTATNGFTTTLSLGQDLENIYDKMISQSSINRASQKKDYIEQKKKAKKDTVTATDVFVKSLLDQVSVYIP